MSDLVVRKLLVDLATPFEARWNGGDAFRSAFFNALSMSFPVGEQYFMDSVRAGLIALSPNAQDAYAQEVKGFVGQEATHRRIHALFNGHLHRLGFINTLELRAARRIQASAHLDVRLHVTATAATEHLTAVFAHWIFKHPEALEGAEPRLQTLWMWHAAEEAEHCSTAFDIYRALGGNERWRIRLFHFITFIFALDVSRQTVRNLWHDNALFKWSTWQSAGNLFFGRDGLIRGNVAAWRAYKSPNFHPRQQDQGAAADWLHSHAGQWMAVGAA